MTFAISPSATSSLISADHLQIVDAIPSPEMTCFKHVITQFLESALTGFCVCCLQTAMGGLVNGRRGGRSPPLMIGALIACILVLGFNYWVSSSRNLELQVGSFLCFCECVCVCVLRGFPTVAYSATYFHPCRYLLSCACHTD